MQKMEIYLRQRQDPVYTISATRENDGIVHVGRGIIYVQKNEKGYNKDIKQIKEEITMKKRRISIRTIFFLFSEASSCLFFLEITHNTKNMPHPARLTINLGKWLRMPPYWHKCHNWYKKYI